MKKLFLLLTMILCLLLAAGCGKGGNGGSGVEENPTGSSIDNGGPKEEGVQPDKFSFSGGTGRVGISGMNIVSRNDAAFMTVVFDSDAYTYIRVGDNKYTCEHADGISYAEIPVLLNENNTIYAETTKMSEAHEIEYQIFPCSAGTADAGKDFYSLLRKQEPDTEAPFIPGLTASSGEPSDAGENYWVFNYDGGIYLLEVKMREGTAEASKVDPAEVTTMAITTEEAQTRLYQNDLVKYLLVPRELVEELPAGIEKEVIVVPIPAEKPYIGIDVPDLKEIVSEGYDLLIINSDSFAQEKENFTSFAGDAANLHVAVLAGLRGDTIYNAFGQ